MRVVVILAVIPLLLGLSKCSKPIPSWDGKLWIGVSDHAAVERAQDPQDPQIRCEDPRFAGYICMSPQDFESFYKTYILSCKEWGSTAEMKPAYEVYKDSFR